MVLFDDDVRVCVRVEIDCRCTGWSWWKSFRWDENVEGNVGLLVRQGDKVADEISMHMAHVAVAQPDEAGTMPSVGHVMTGIGGSSNVRNDCSRY